MKAVPCMQDSFSYFYREMDQPVQIILATSSQAGLIADLARRTFMETYGEMNTKENMESYLASQFGEEKITCELENRNARFFLAYQDGIPAGFTKLRDDRVAKQLENNRSLEIQRIYVLQEYQGFKIGKALIEMVKSLARKERYSTIWLQVWHKNNKAIHFYQKAGFMVYETASFQLGQNIQQDYLMRHDLYI